MIAQCAYNMRGEGKSGNSWGFGLMDADCFYEHIRNVAIIIGEEAD